MKIGIDATNLRSGGSLTHIGELLSAARPEEQDVNRVVVWAGREVMDRLPSRPWLEAVHEPMLDRPLPVRVLWQQTKLASLARKASCGLLFVPGGTYLGDFRPFVTMSHNMLLFDGSQMKLYGRSPRLLKFLLLRYSQSTTFRKADGTIFLDDYARSRVIESVRRLAGRETVIPHGISRHFRRPPRVQKPLCAYSRLRRFRLLYASTVDAYKHQWRVAEAVVQLVESGLPLSLELVGPAHHPAIGQLENVVRRHRAEGYIHYRGYRPYGEMPAFYKEGDGFVFASTCENLPNCLLEAMNAGLPIACSDRRPMPDILGGGGVYFNAADTADITRALRHLVTSPEAREGYAAAAYDRAQQYSWERCAKETFSFLRAIA